VIPATIVSAGSVLVTVAVVAAAVAVLAADRVWRRNRRTLFPYHAAAKRK
jgi:hypothetical protein